MLEISEKNLYNKGKEQICQIIRQLIQKKKNIKITEITIQHELDLEKLDPEEKGGRLDLQAKLNDGVIVNIELQVENKHNLEGRTKFYSAKVISMETERGTDYKDIKKEKSNIKKSKRRNYIFNRRCSSAKIRRIA